MRILIFEKWMEGKVRKEYRRQFLIGTDAASVQDAIEQFDAANPRPAHGMVLDRDVRDLG